LVVSELSGKAAEVYARAGIARALYSQSKRAKPIRSQRLTKLLGDTISQIKYPATAPFRLVTRRSLVNTHKVGTDSDYRHLANPTLVYYNRHPVTATAFLLSNIHTVIFKFTMKHRVMGDSRIITVHREDYDRDEILAETQLEFIPSFNTEWYGWTEYHPTTAIYGVPTNWVTVTGPSTRGGMG